MINDLIIEFGDDIMLKRLYTRFYPEYSESYAIHHNFTLDTNIYRSEKRYFKKLFKWMLKTDRDLIKVDDWPDEFIETLDDYYKNLLRSGKTINKFNL